MRRARSITMGSCVENKKVTPISSLRLRIRSNTFPPLTLSRLAVGSSAMMMAGFLTSARAMATRCCCVHPRVGWVCDARDLRVPRKPEVRLRLSWLHLRVRCRRILGKLYVFQADKTGMRLKDWKINPMDSARSLVSSLSERLLVTVSLMVTVPLVGLSSRPMRFSAVVLPEPEGQRER